MVRRLLAVAGAVGARWPAASERLLTVGFVLFVAVHDVLLRRPPPPA